MAEPGSCGSFLPRFPEIVAPLQLTKKLKYFDRRIYTLKCNWKVYVDNYSGRRISRAACAQGIEQRDRIHEVHD